MFTTPPNPSSFLPHLTTTAPSADRIMSHSSLASPTEILHQANSPPPYTPPPPTHLSHEQKLQWHESAHDLMDATLDKWTTLAMPLTTIKDIRNTAKIAARLAKIWALAQSDPT